MNIFRELMFLQGHFVRAEDLFDSVPPPALAPLPAQARPEPDRLEPGRLEPGRLEPSCAAACG